jgi:Transposase DDE domain
MTSIPQVSRMLKTLFEEDAVELGKQAGLRQRTMSFTQLAWLLVLGWWKQPEAGPSALARFAGSLDLTLSKQAVDCHLTPRTASWLLALLRRAVEYVVCAGAIDLPLLQRFSAVLLEDGSSISLPSALKEVWGGCGGSRASRGGDPKNQAALKLTVRWDLLAGRMHGPYLQEGRRHELSSVLREHHMPKGSLWIADLGYWALKWLCYLSQEGVFFLMRYKAGIVLWVGKERLDLLATLPKATGERLELLVDVAADRRLKQVRLLAERVPPEVASARQERIREAASRHGKPLNPLVMELANWTLVITNVPAHVLSFSQAFALLRARWQIELLFKLWKQDGLLDTWRSTRPWHVLCQVYAKLLAMVVQHWFVLLSCWDDPHHSLSSVAEVLREQLPTLVHGLCRRLPLGRAIRLMLACVRGACSIPARSTRPSTSHLLWSALDFGLT